jgi:hypothetical protein
MVQGARGWHETRNRTAVAMIPGYALASGGYGPPMVLDDFIDSIDMSGPIIPLGPCWSNCDLYAAMSISNDSVVGWAVSAYPSAGMANEAASDLCVQNARELCSTVVVAGSSWIVGVHCQNDRSYWTEALPGNDPESATVDAFRIAVQQRGFSPNDCSVIGVVAGDGGQQNFVQK